MSSEATSIANGYTALDVCLACGSNALFQFLDLDSQPLANSFHTKSDSILSYPLALKCCSDCFHSQLSVSVDPTVLFSDYVYVSGTTVTLRAYFEEFADDLERRLGPSLRVIEIASNDGSLLSILNSRGHSTLGIDPAANLCAISSASGVNTICAFWPSNLPAFLKSDSDAIIAMNVFAHVPDPLSFLAGLKAVMNSKTRVLIQTSQSNMIQNCEFDTTYHEHLSFFNVKSMKALVARAGLVLTDVTTVPVHGVSYLWEIMLEDESRVTENVLSRFEKEETDGLYEEDIYRAFDAKAKNIIAKTVQELSKLQDEGYRLVGYGAAAKGNTFLNASGIQLECVVDDNPGKQGLLCPGSRIEVVAMEATVADSRKTAYLVPAWNFKNEIAMRISKVRANPDDLLVTYFPRLEVTRISEFH